MLGAKYGTFCGHSTEKFYGLFCTSQKIRTRHFHKEQIQAVVELQKCADISLSAAMKVIGSNAEQISPDIEVPPKIDVGLHVSRVAQIKLFLPPKPEKGYHSRRYQHIDELIGICESLMAAKC